MPSGSHGSLGCLGREGAPGLVSVWWGALRNGATPPSPQDPGPSQAALQGCGWGDLKGCVAETREGRGCSWECPRGAPAVSGAARPGRGAGSLDGVGEKSGTSCEGLGQASTQGLRRPAPSPGGHSDQTLVQVFLLLQQVHWWEKGEQRGQREGSQAETRPCPPPKDPPNPRYQTSWSPILPILSVA